MASSTAPNKEVTGKRHYSKSYYQYRERNPTISIKVTKKTKEALDKVRGEMSYSEFLKSLVAPGGAFAKFEKQRARLAAERAALEQERTDLENEWVTLEEEKAALEKERERLSGIERLVIPCYVCGDPIVVDNQNTQFWNEQVKPILDKRVFRIFHKRHYSGDPRYPLF